MLNFINQKVTAKRKQVSIRAEQWHKLNALRIELEIMTGREVQITEAMGRAIDCMDDAHRRGAWLSPEEARGVMDERLKLAVALALRHITEGKQPSLDTTVINLN